MSWDDRPENVPVESARRILDECEMIMVAEKERFQYALSGHHTCDIGQAPLPVGHLLLIFNSIHTRLRI